MDLMDLQHVQKASLSQENTRKKMGAGPHEEIHVASPMISGELQLPCG